MVHVWANAIDDAVFTVIATIQQAFTLSWVLSVLPTWFSHARLYCRELRCLDFLRWNLVIFVQIAVLHSGDKSEFGYIIALPYRHFVVAFVR